MATPTRRLAPPQPKASIAPLVPWGWSLFDLLFEAQQLQMHALIVWQETIATLGKDFWDQCAVRYCGGVPIDS